MESNKQDGPMEFGSWCFPILDGPTEMNKSIGLPKWDQQMRLRSLAPVSKWGLAGVLSVSWPALQMGTSRCSVGLLASLSLVSSVRKPRLVIGDGSVEVGEACNRPMPITMVIEIH